MVWIIPLFLLLLFVVLWLLGERGHLCMPSTRAWIRENGWRRVLSLEALHGYIYARWTNQYIRGLVGLSNRLPKPSTPSQQAPDPKHRTWLSDHYHGKVIPPDLAKAIVTLDHDIPEQDLEQIIPYPMARTLVLQGPPDVVAYECGCRHSVPHPCQPTQVCMVIGQPFASLVLEHNPHSSRKLTQAEAIQLLEEEHQRGHLHSAWFKDACLGRFYAICNCCKCCCQALKGRVMYGSPMMSSSGFVAEVTASECVGCGACAEACPFLALSVQGTSQVKWDLCMGCGVCVSRCPHEAIHLIRDEKKGVPFDVRALATGG